MLIKSIVLESGDRVGRLSIIKEVSPRQYPCGAFARYFLVKCDCGVIKDVAFSNLRIGNTKSCGCIRREKMADKQRTHGLSKTRHHGIWKHMVQRTCNSKSKFYSSYGGRGIFLCEEWKEYINFYNDTYDSYIDHVNLYGEKNTSIDRINNDDGYYKVNCRWATPKIQKNNQRPRVRTFPTTIEFNGETKHVKEWAEKTGIKYGTILSRLKKGGWSVEKALSTPTLKTWSRHK